MKTRTGVGRCCCGAAVCEGGCTCSVTTNYVDDFADGTMDTDWVGPFAGTLIDEVSGKLGMVGTLTDPSGYVERCLALPDMTNKRLFVRFTAGPVSLAAKMTVRLKLYQCVFGGLLGDTPTCVIGADTYVQWNDGLFFIYGFGYGWSECTRISDSATSDGDYTEPAASNPATKTFSIEVEWIDSITNEVTMTFVEDGNTMESSDFILGQGNGLAEMAVLRIDCLCGDAREVWIDDLEFGTEDIV